MTAFHASTMIRGRSAPHQRGFNLVELMVALVAGLVVSLAAVAFFLSSMKSNTDFVAGTRLTQELRNNMDYVSRELRRAGYDENALTYVALPSGSTTRSPFSTIELVNDGATDSCILFAYDGADGDFGEIDPELGERHGLRRMLRNVNGIQVGVIEVADSDATATDPECDGATPDYSVYPPACNSASGWCALSDPRQLNVTAFTITVTGNNTTPAAGAFGTLVRDYAITLTGSLLNDTTVTQSVQNSVRIRSECLFTAGNMATECSDPP